MIFDSCLDWCRSIYGGVCGVMVIVSGIGNGHGETSSNPGWDRLHFTWHKYPWGIDEFNYSPSPYVWIIG